MSNDTILKLDEVYFSYREPKLRDWFGMGFKIPPSKSDYNLRDINLTIDKGEFCGLIGRNGAGKSTLLKIISGIYTHDHGRIIRPPKIANLLELGAAFNLKSTGLENLALTCLLNNVPSTMMKTKIEEMVDFADLGSAINHPVVTYSSGMFARLAFSSQVHLEADFILVDEVLSVGDANFVNKANRKMDALRSQGVTFLFVTHDMTAVKAMCDKVLWIDNGEIREQGAAGPTVDNYLVDISEGNVMGQYPTREPMPINICGASIEHISKQSRRGLGELIFEKIDVYSDSINASDVILEQGKSLKFRSIIRNVSCLDSKNMFVGISLRNRRGVDICSVNSKDLGVIAPKTKVGDTITLDVDLKLPILQQGEYSISVSLAVGGNTNTNMDTIDDAFLLRIYGNIKVHTFFQLNGAFQFV